MRGQARTAWRLVRRGPGPWLLAASLCGWIVLLAGVGVASAATPAMTMHHGGAGQGEHHGVAGWFAMVTAMTPLVVRSEVAWLWRTSLPRNRGAAIALFALAHVAPWIALGPIVTRLPLVDGVALIVAVALLLAWHGSPWRQRVLNACHRRPPRRAFGSGMAADTVAFGLRSGLLCTATCGPAMLVAMALPGGHVVAMAGVTIVVTVERYLAPRRPAWRLPWAWIDRAPRWHALRILPAPPAPFARIS